MIRTLLIANRGEIACRILATCGRLGIRGVVVYSDADAQSLAVRTADEAIRIGAAPARDSYLNIDAILLAAQQCGADAVHPGYGFLAENAEFARRVVESGLIFVGPRPDVIAQMGSKVVAREVCHAAGVPLLAGSGGLDDQGLLDWAEQHGYPVMLKASAGGGGKGMRRISDRSALEQALGSARREAAQAFGGDELYLEKALDQPRHLEVQVIGDHHGHHLHLGVRECSLQRRHQKIIEESPPPCVPPSLLASLTRSALALARYVDYTGVGTVEFLVSGSDFHFLEMNTRLQVEHPVTEAVTGLDMVELQILIAEDGCLPMTQSEVIFRGHAIEARLTSEVPSQGFLPSTGSVLHWRPSHRARIDSGIDAESTVGQHYDSMLAKVICWGENRASALRRLEYSLRNTVLLGVHHNLDFLVHLLHTPEVVAGRQHTELVESLPCPTSEVTVHQLLAVAAVRCALEAPAFAEDMLGAVPFTMAFADLPVVRLEAGQFWVEGSSYQVAIWPGTLQVDGRRMSAFVAREGDVWWVHTPEGTARLVGSPRLPVPRVAASAGSLRAPLPGSVSELLVKLGDQVKADQPLLKLEAMKMEHIICAPKAGQIERLPYGVGDQVNAGAELIGLSE